MKTPRRWSALSDFCFSIPVFLSLPIPLHRDFEEVNLRFYVRRKSDDTWRRGVVFVRELVPRRAIALVARAFYGERYFALPMKHKIEHVDPKLHGEYCWRRGKKWEFLKMSACGQPQSISAGAHAEFIMEHYWGYTCVRDGCSEYRVDRPRWKIWNATNFELHANVTSLYGEQFAETFSQPPRSAFIADGSQLRREVIVISIAVASAQTEESRHADSNRPRLAYQCEPSQARSAFGDPCLRSRALRFGRA